MTKQSKSAVETHFDETIGATPVQEYDFNPKALGIKDRRIVELLQRASPDGKACLDIGPGTGRWLKFLKQNGAISLVGVDVSSEVLERCAPLCDSTQKLDVEVDTLDYGDNSFDIIISIEVLEHLQDPDIYFSEIIRVAKPGANVVMSLPNIASMMSRFRLLFGYLPTAIASDPTHVRFYLQNDIALMLAKRGQNVAFVPTSFSLHPFNRKSWLRMPTNGFLSSFDDSLLFSFKVAKLR